MAKQTLFNVQIESEYLKEDTPILKFFTAEQLVVFSDEFIDYLNSRKDNTWFPVDLIIGDQVIKDGLVVVCLKKDIQL